MDYTLDIDFANIRQAKILKLSLLRDKAIASFRNRFAEDAENVALAFALKLSISGSNLSRMVPMTVRGHNVASETFISCVAPRRGQDVDEDSLTVSRYCAALAGDISKYLDQHHDKVRNVVEGVAPKLSFPHNYYVQGLSDSEKDQCIVWLKHHDGIMNRVTRGQWRELSLKAIAYFTAQP